jgi:hypothetical protein
MRTPVTVSTFKKPEDASFTKLCILIIIFGNDELDTYLQRRNVGSKVSERQAFLEFDSS